MYNYSKKQLENQHTLNDISEKEYSNFDSFEKIQDHNNSNSSIKVENNCTNMNDGFKLHKSRFYRDTSSVKVENSYLGMDGNFGKREDDYAETEDSFIGVDDNYTHVDKRCIEMEQSSDELLQKTLGHDITWNKVIPARYVDGKQEYSKYYIRL